MTVERFEIADRNAWLALRLQNVNASEVAICCGEGPYGSLAELYAEKKGLRPPRADSGLLRRGRWLEASVFEALAEMRPDLEIRRARIYLRDPELRLGATPDGFALLSGGRIVVQAKTISRSMFRKRWLLDPDSTVENGDAEPPIYYVLQVLTEMLLSDSAYGLLAVLVVAEFDSVLRTFEIERNEEVIERILRAVDTFWREHFDPGIMPDFQPLRDAALIVALYPKDDGSLIDLTTNNRAGAVVELLIETAAAIKGSTATSKAAKAELQAILKDHTYGLLADGRCISWKRQHRRGYTVEPSNPRVLKILKQPPKVDDAEETDETD